MNPVTLGQHFLTNKNIARKMIDLVLPLESPVLEIGPGTGILTRLLAENRNKQEIILVEVDPDLARNLREKFPDQCLVFQDSILNIHLDRVFSKKEILCLGNIPYYLSKELIDWTIQESDNIKSGLYMMQKEFVDKLIHGNKSRINSQALMFRFVFDSQKKFNVRPGSFSPPPAVLSTVFKFEKKTDLPPNSNRKAFYQFLRLCFKNRRKTLINSLVHRFDRENLLSVFRNGNIDPDARAEQLVLRDFIGIFQKIENQKRPVT